MATSSNGEVATRRRESTSRHRIATAVSLNNARRRDEDAEIAAVWTNAIHFFATSVGWAARSSAKIAIVSDREVLRKMLGTTTSNASSTKAPAPYVPRFSLLHGGLSATTDHQRRVEFPKTSKKFSNVTERELWIYRNAAFPHMLSVIDRVFTFQGDWTANCYALIAKQKNGVVEAAYCREVRALETKLPKYGFFYAGTRDVVTCYFCGLSLRDWFEKSAKDEPSRTVVDPREEHRRWFSDCFLLNDVCVYDDDSSDTSDDDLSAVVNDVRRKIHKYRARTVPATRSRVATNVACTPYAATVRTHDGEEFRYPSKSQVDRFDDLTRFLCRQYATKRIYSNIMRGLTARVEHLTMNARASWELARAIIEGMTYVRENDQVGDLITMQEKLEIALSSEKRTIEEYRTRRSTGLLFGYSDSPDKFLRRYREAFSQNANRERYDEDHAALCACLDDDDGPRDSNGLTQKQREYYENSTVSLTVATEGRRDDAATLEKLLECTVCYENVRDCLTLPCRHMVTCASCAINLSTCPVCREIVWTILPVLRS